MNYYNFVIFLYNNIFHHILQVSGRLRKIPAGFLSDAVASLRLRRRPEPPQPTVSLIKKAESTRLRKSAVRPEIRVCLVFLILTAA